MKNTIQTLIVLCFLVTLFQGCAGQNDKEVLARVEQKYVITLGDFNDRISKLPERYQDIVKKNKKQFLDELIIDTLLYNEALKQGFQKEEDTKKLIEEAKRKILIARLLKDDVDQTVTVNETEIETYYNQNKDKFQVPEVLRASHILVENEADAKDIRAQLARGANFEELARANSIDPTAKVGGDIGYFTKGQLVPEVEEVCFKMQVGDLSDVVKTKFGYHVIKLTERRQPRVKELVEVHDAIEQSLQRLKKKVLFNEYVGRLKEKARISVNNNLLQSIQEEDQVETSEKPQE